MKNAQPTNPGEGTRKNASLVAVPQRGQLVFVALLPRCTNLRGIELSMRYKEGELPDPNYTHTEGMHILLMFSVVLALIVGLILFYLGYRGKVMWLQAWSVGLVLCSVLYMANTVWKFF